MHTRKTILFGIMAVVATIGIAGGTFYLLRNVDKGSQVAPAPNDEAEEVAELPSGVDAGLNAKAMTVEADAMKMMETDPIAASKKYEEAAAMYTEAKNFGKAADMTDSARTAATMTPAEDPVFGEPVISH